MPSQNKVKHNKRWHLIIEGRRNGDATVYGLFARGRRPTIREWLCLHGQYTQLKRDACGCIRRVYAADRLHVCIGLNIGHVITIEKQISE